MKKYDALYIFVGIAKDDALNAYLEKERAKDIRNAEMEALQRRIDEVNRKSDELNKQLEALLKGLLR